MAALRWNGTVLVLEIHTQPNASSDTWGGLHGERIKVRVAAPAVGGQANERLVAFLANEFDVPRRQVTLISGSHSRTKTVQIEAPVRVPAQISALPAH